MTPDDLSEDPAYYDRRFDPEKLERRERLKAKRELAEQATPPINRQKMLQRIIDDTAEPYSVRMDARRLQEIFYMRPKDFLAEYEAFLQWRSETSKCKAE